jgi:hypothetical protein
VTLAPTSGRGPTPYALDTQLPRKTAPLPYKAPATQTNTPISGTPF